MFVAAPLAQPILIHLTQILSTAAISILPLSPQTPLPPIKMLKRSTKTALCCYEKIRQENVIGIDQGLGATILNQVVKEELTQKNDI